MGVIFAQCRRSGQGYGPRKKTNQAGNSDTLPETAGAATPAKWPDNQRSVPLAVRLLVVSSDAGFSRLSGGAI